MTPEIRRAALRAAAKTALLAALGGGCGGSNAQTTNPSNTAPGDTKPAVAVVAPAGDCDTYLKGLPSTDPSSLPAGDPDRETPGIYSIFTNPGDRTAERTVSCCRSALETGGAQATQRFACCATLHNAVPTEGEPFACTPWGPPCPPEMGSDPIAVVAAARAVA